MSLSTLTHPFSNTELYSLSLSPSHSHTESQPLSLSLSTLTHSPSSLTHCSLSQFALSVSIESDSSPSSKDFIKPHQRVHRFEFLQCVRGLSNLKKKKWVALYKVHCLVAKKQWEKSKKLWFHPPWVSYFGFFIEFLIELFKKIETLLFFEIELVCGFDFLIWFLFFYLWFCFALCSVCGLILGKFQIYILNYAFYSCFCF